MMCILFYHKIYYTTNSSYYGFYTIIVIVYNNSNTEIHTTREYSNIVYTYNIVYNTYNYNTYL